LYVVSATGAAFNRSLGHRPRNTRITKIGALKARFIPRVPRELDERCLWRDFKRETVESRFQRYLPGMNLFFLGRFPRLI